MWREAAVRIGCEGVGNNCLDCAGEDVAVVRQAGGERRPVVERPHGLAQRLLQGLLEDAVLLPPRQDLLLLLRKGDAVGHCHQAWSRQRACARGVGVGTVAACLR